MLVMYLNLDRATARNSFMQEMFLARGIPARRIAAIDGATLSDFDRENFAPPTPGLHRLAKTEIGCFLSHRKAWAEIAASACAWGCVFEDDVLLADDAARFLLSTDWLPRDAHLIKLETFPHQTMTLGKRLKSAGGGRSLVRLYSASIGAGGYVIRRDIAVRMLARTTSFTVPVDYAMFDPIHLVLPRTRIYQLVPANCIQQKQAMDLIFMPPDADLSMIEDERKVMEMIPRRKYAGWAKVGRELRRIKRQITDMLFTTLPKLLNLRRERTIGFARSTGDSFTHGSMSPNTGD